MIQILLLLLLFIFIIPIFILMEFVGRIFRPRGQHTPNTNTRSEKQRSTWHNTQANQRKKRIEDNEGEYIDFEEVDE